MQYKEILYRVVLKFRVLQTVDWYELLQHKVPFRSLPLPGLDLAARYSQKCEWVFQIFPVLQERKSITCKFLRVDLILIKLIYNVKVLKSVKLKLTQVFLHIFSPANCVKDDSQN